MATYDDMMRAAKQQALWQGLMGLGGQMLQGGDPRQPQSFGAGLGRGVQGFGQGYNNAFSNQLQSEMGRLKFAEADRQKALDERRQQYIGTLPPDQQAAAAVAPDAFFGAQAKSMFPSPAPQPNSIKEFEYAKANGFTGSYADFLQTGRQQTSQETFGNNPIWGTDAQGNPVLMQPSNRGGVRQVQLPPGVTAQRGQTSRVDLGDKVGILDANGAIIGYQQKGIAPENTPAARGAVTEATTIAGAQAEAKMGLPSAVAEAENSIKLVDDLVKHPGMSQVVGAPGSVPGAVYQATGKALPGTEVAGFKARLDQIMGKQFLAAFESLKGGGQITQIEGEKATAAMSRLSQTGQTEAEYMAAAKELRDIMKAGVERAKMKAGQGGAPTATANDPLGLR